MDLGLLKEIVGAPDRDQMPGALGVVSVDESDDVDFLSEVEARERARVPLRRRDIDHGSWAEIDTAGFFEPIKPDVHAWRQRWADARPIKLEGALLGSLQAFAPLLGERDRWAKKLDQTGDGGLLDRMIEAGLGRLDPGFDVLAPGESASLAKRLEARLGSGAEGVREWRFFQSSGYENTGGVPGFWIKNQALSRVVSDRSGRVRFSFGLEGEDDASHDHARLQRVGELARGLLPETALLRDNAELLALLEELDNPLGDDPGEFDPKSLEDAEPEVQSPVDPRVKPGLYFTQDIAYWNAPNGGALMHHDAFEEEYEDRQRAVVYAQLSGATAWIALSTQDLAARVEEFTEALADGDMPWVRNSLFRGQAGESLMRKILKGGRFVYGEIEKPGCGQLGRVINRGPEFTSLLADAGHAFILRAGDIVLLPNHGLGHTTMHSVFCASETPAYSLSLALRRAPANLTPLS